MKLVGKYSMKTKKYRNAARDNFIPEAGYGSGDELNCFIRTRDIE